MESKKITPPNHCKVSIFSSQHFNTASPCCCLCGINCGFRSTAVYFNSCVFQAGLLTFSYFAPLIVPSWKFANFFSMCKKAARRQPAFARVLGCAACAWSLTAENFHQRYLRSRCGFQQPQNTPWPCKSRLFLPSSSEEPDSRSSLPDKNRSAAKLELNPSYLSPSPKNIKNIKMGVGVPEKSKATFLLKQLLPLHESRYTKAAVKQNAPCEMLPSQGQLYRETRCLYSTSRLTATPFFGLKTGSVPLPLSAGLKPGDLTQRTAARVLHSTPAASSYAV